MSERSQSPPPQEDVKPKVIYVMGAGRSGSTILGVTLGNCENVFYAGELDKWLVKSGVSQHPGAQRTRFWATVREQVDGAEELFGGEAHHSLERSSALFRVRRWPARHRLRPRYLQVSQHLYEAVARASNATHIVDTSHYPLRARELKALAGIEFYLLFLVRNPHGVVASLDRRDVVERRFGTFTANAYLWLTNLVSVFVFLRHRRDRRLLVRYEEFIADPERVVGDVLTRFEVSATPPELSALRTGIAFQGNRLIESEVIALQREASASRRRSPVTMLLQLPWMPILSRLRPTAASSARELPTPATDVR